MKRKTLVSLTIAVTLLFVFVLVANAFTFGNVDGVWGFIDDGFDGIRLDVVGVVGNNPGSGYWGSGTKTTQDDTLIRNSSVCSGDPDGDSTLGEWTGISPAVNTNLGSHTIGSCTTQGFFISEYIEGTGDPGQDAIELYNNMGQAIDLAQTPYYIQIFNDGATRPSVVITLNSGTIAAGATYVIARVDISGVTENLLNTSLSFTGNDAVALVKNYVADTGGNSDDDAENSQWATGPAGENPNISTGRTVNTNWFDQTTGYSNTDWNQVRYGSSNFDTASGLAFNGIDSAPASYLEGVPFPLGKFCHINHPISFDNGLVNVPLSVTMSNISCEAPALPPYPPATLPFVYPVNLDETPNNASPCPYGDTQPCGDAVTFGQPANQTFMCNYTGGVTKKFTVAIVGFMHLANSTDSCNGVAYDQSQADGIFFSDESATNCGCLFGMITESIITAVDLISFEAAGTAEGVSLTWRTANEIDNLGFNLYRAESADGEKVKLNSDLIPTNVAPGSPFGAAYAYDDLTAEAGVTYFYWLEDVDFSGAATQHGPVEGARQ